MHAPRSLLAIIVAAILLPGCKRQQDIVTYNAPKPPPQQAAATQEAVASASALTQGVPDIPGVTYIMPTGWKPEKVHTFEAARFDPGAGDGKTVFSVSTLGPGFDFPTNVERWQKQVGMTATPPDAQAGLSKDMTVGGASAKAFDLKGATGESYVVVVQRPDATWVFKLMGAADKVQLAKPAADAFLQSVKFGESTPTAAAPPMPQEPTTPTPSAGSPSAVPFTYTAPSNWQLDPQPHDMRVATWTAGSGASKVEIYITEPIPANMFDIPSNVNRWRNQVGLPPDTNISANPTSDVKIGDQQGIMLDMTGPAQDGKPAKRMAVAFAGKQNLWFFKIIGPADAVGQQKAEFEKFLASVKFKPGAQ